MAKVKVKGTIWQVRISGVYTAVAQFISLDIGEVKPDTFDASTIDSGAAKSNESTGYVTHGDMSGELFLDLALAGHRFLTATASAPVDVDTKVIMADAGSREITGTIVSLGLGVAFDMNDGLKSSFTATPKAGWTFPSS